MGLGVVVSDRGIRTGKGLRIAKCLRTGKCLRTISLRTGKNRPKNSKPQVHNRACL
jgi:hypothetical protein